MIYKEVFFILFNVYICIFILISQLELLTISWQVYNLFVNTDRFSLMIKKGTWEKSWKNEKVNVAF